MKVAIYSGHHRVADAYYRESDYLFKMCGGNTGNFAIINSIFDHLSHAASYVEIVPWESDPARIHRDFDLIVFACANMLGSHTDLGGIGDLLSSADLPIIALGLGAQASDMSAPIELTSGTKRWVDVIARSAPSSAPNIGVRGQFTLQQLDRLGLAERASVIGCPSNLTNPRSDLGSILSSKTSHSSFDRIAVPAGLPYWPDLMLIERSLVRIVEDCSGIYIAQHDIDMVRMARDEAHLVGVDKLEHLQRYLGLAGDISDLKSWFRRYAVCFLDATSWMESMRKFDFAVGVRFHGVMLALQAGTPGGVITHDSRTAELCDTMAIPSVEFSRVRQGVRKEDLNKYFDLDWDRWSRIRRDLCQSYIGILEGAGLTADPMLKAIARQDASSC